MANTETVPDHIHLSYGNCEKHFLKEDATPAELHEYVCKFYKSFFSDKNINLETLRISQTEKRTHLVTIEPIYSPEEAYALEFHDVVDPKKPKLTRSYEIFPDRIERRFEM